MKYIVPNKSQVLYGRKRLYATCYNYSGRANIVKENKFLPGTYHVKGDFGGFFTEGYVYRK